MKLLLPVSQELANHLPTQAFPLEQEMSHAHRSVWNKAALDQILDAFFWFSGKRERELPPGSTQEGRRCPLICGVNKRQ